MKLQYQKKTMVDVVEDVVMPCYSAHYDILDNSTIFRRLQQSGMDACMLRLSEIQIDDDGEIAIEETTISTDLGVNGEHLLGHSGFASSETEWREAVARVKTLIERIAL